MKNEAYQVCTRCVMDTTAADIEFNEDGHCHYCAEFLAKGERLFRSTPDARKKELDGIVARIKAKGKRKPYDCVIGVSGGVDSSWLLVQAVSLGLRPLAVHMDNGWNSELAQNNIANLVRNLGIDLHTHVIDWHEYKNLMQAFFDADVIDVELLYDNAMLAVNHRAAVRHGLRYILAGYNKATEGMAIPQEWNWFKYDKRNIKALGRQFGKTRLQSFPAVGTVGYTLNNFVRGIRWVAPLDFIEYNKEEAVQALISDFGYKPYPYKHYESIFTRFYQGFILPAKFGIDKRRVHLGTLVVSGQLSREDAVAKLEESPYPSEDALNSDKQYFLKKMGWTPEQLDDYIARPEKSHSVYGTEKPLWDYLYTDSKDRWAFRAVWRGLTGMKQLTNGQLFQSH
ncbi:MAG: N-acetyl sugar amidotransferase [Fuerstiella sp.]|nr:N-acetyl sugar amidotransferase [Fuerstiella sp.]